MNIFTCSRVTIDDVGVFIKLCCYVPVCIIVPGSIIQDKTHYSTQNCKLENVINGYRQGRNRTSGWGPGGGAMPPDQSDLGPKIFSI